MITLIIYPNALLSILIGFSIPAFLIYPNQYSCTQSLIKFSPYKYMTDLSMEMFMHNSLISCIYGRDRCPLMTISIKLESYNMNHRHSFLSNIIKIFINLVIIKCMSLLTLLYKNRLLMNMVNMVRKNNHSSL